MPLHSMAACLFITRVMRRYVALALKDHPDEVTAPPIAGIHKPGFPLEYIPVRKTSLACGLVKNIQEIEPTS